MTQHKPPPPAPFPPGMGFNPKPGLDGKNDMQDHKKSGRQHRRNLASPCDRPPAVPTGVQMIFRAVEAKTHLNFKARIVWDDVTTDSSGITINTVDRWDIEWRALDADGDPVETEHAALRTATNPAGTTFQYRTARNTDWNVGDRVKVTGCFPETNYNGTFTITAKPTADLFEVNGGHSGEIDAKRAGEVYNLSTDESYRRKLRNPQPRQALRSATHTTSPNRHHFTTRGDNGFYVGNRVTVTGCRPQVDYNGTYTIENIVDSNTFTVLAGSGPLADAEVLGSVLDRDDFRHIVVTHLPRPKTWYWQARVRCRSGEGCWSAFSAWTTPVLPWDGADPSPPVPDYGAFPITFDHKGKGKHRKIRLLFTYDEVKFWDVPGGDREDDVAGYDVQLDSSTDGLNWDTTRDGGQPYRTMHRPGNDDDADTTRTAVFGEIHRRYWYRCRVRTRDRFGRKGDWSDWTNPALPFDDTSPPTPLQVEVFPASTDRIVVAWDDPTIALPCVGTVVGTAGTATLTGTGTHFNRQVEAGSVIKIAPNYASVAAAAEYTVKKVTSATALTLTSNLLTSPTGEIVWEIADDPDVALYAIQIATFANVDTGVAPNEWSDVYAHDRSTGNRKAFKIKDADTDETFFARVRALDAAANRSVWIPAWDRTQHSGVANDDPNADGDGVVVIPGAGTVTNVWSHSGRLDTDYTTDPVVPGALADPYEIAPRFQNDTGIKLWFKHVHLSCGDQAGGTGAPSGSNIFVQLRRWQTDGTTVANVFSPSGPDDRPRIQTGEYVGNAVQADFTITHLNPGEAVSCSLAQYGSGASGRDLFVTLTMSPAAPVQ